MTALETENAAALAEVYEGDLADNGVQAEAVTIDGAPVFGSLSFDSEQIQIMPGGWNENVKAVFSTLKSYFPTGYPKPFGSCMEVTANGRVTKYQVVQINGDKDNRASLQIGVAAFTNRKG